VAAPTDCAQPGAGGHGRWRKAASVRPCWRNVLPTVEPCPRRANIDTAPGRLVLTPIVNNVHERIAHLARSTERSRVVTIAEDPSGALERAIDGSSGTNRQSRHAARERALVVRLHEEMEMIGLHGKVDKPKSRTGRSSQCPSYSRENGLFAQRRQAPPYAQGDMYGVAPLVLGPRPMGDPASASGGFASGALTPAASGSRCRQRTLNRRSHLDWADNRRHAIYCQYLLAISSFVGRPE
jgi:hypothetical protein